MAAQLPTPESAVTHPATGASPAPATGTLPSGRALVLAQAAWFLLASLLLGLFAVLLLAHRTHLRTVCVEVGAGNGAGCSVAQPNPASVQDLHQLGISVPRYATRTFGLALTATLLCLAVAVVIVWRKSDDWLMRPAQPSELTPGPRGKETEVEAATTGAAGVSMPAPLSGAVALPDAPMG